MLSLRLIIVCLILPLVVNAGNPEDYRFPREPGTTEDGFPLALSGVPITKTPVIANPGVKVKDYPEHYIPGRETLSDDEMRVTACGSGGPAPLRISQGAACFLVQLGNGDTFIFDIGPGTVGNLFALGVHPSELDKVFITHLHLDHIGSIFPLFDAMGWARNTPLQLWGSSGFTPELGIKAFANHVRQASEWHIQNKQNILPKGGMTIVANEFDYSKFSPENPRQLVYEENGVKIYAFPIVHALAGSVGYRLEWNDLTFVYVSDSQPSRFEAEQGKGADIFVNEVFPYAEEFAHYGRLPIESAEGVLEEHTTAEQLGNIFSIAKPRLGAGMHYTLDDELTDPLFERWSANYSGPLLLMQDLTTVNVTSEYIVVRQTKADLLAWPPPPKPPEEGVDMSKGVPTKAVTPDWLTETLLLNED
ncbi:MAG: MBL fold metallo-hydrolase [Xanthomonadales bacterium]|nr:MBL fold metallo-hydrolase [Xanthomonadales bacterium]